MQQNNEDTNNIVYVGDKPVASYVLGVTTQATRENNIFIMARGRWIGKAVDVVLATLERNLSGFWEKGQVEIYTEMKEENQRVSVIKIEIYKIPEQEEIGQYDRRT